MNKLLEIIDMSKTYDNFKLNKINIVLEEGDITGFIGENGSGKTTTMELVMNLIKKDSGSIKYNGKDVKNIKDLNGVGYLGANNDIYPKITLKSYKNFIKKAYANTWSEDKYQNYKKLLNVNEEQRLSELSTGMRVKYFICLELAKQPKLLLLDEPTAGLDPVVRDEVLSYLQELVNKEKLTVLFSSHITSDIDAIAKKVIFIHEGTIVLDAPKESIKNNFVKCEQYDFSKLSSREQEYIIKNGVKSTSSYILHYSRCTDNIKEYVKSVSLDDILLYIKGGNLHA